MTSTLRIAILGTAHVHTTDHLEVIEADHRVVLAAPGDADAVVICSTTADHARLLSGVVAAGLPALVEKPLAATAEETAELAGLIDRGTAPVTTAMFLRCAPALGRVEELLAAGALGEVVSADLRFSHPGLLDGLFADDAAWMLDPKRGGTGAFADLGIHLIDLLCCLRPAADITVHGARLRVPPDHALDLGGTAVLEWGGAPAALHAGWTSRPGGVRIHIEGTRGSLTVQDGSLTLSLGRVNRVERHAPPSAGDALSAFLADLRGESTWRRPTVADMLRCAIVLEEIGAADRALRRDE